MDWTPEKTELLRMLWDEGLSASAIADRLGDGVSRNAVIGKAHRLGLEARPSPVKTAEDARPVDGVALNGNGAEPGTPANADGTAVPVAPARKPRPKVAKPVRTTLLDLNDKVCKWPIGHPGEADFHFCGQPVNPGFPYCEEHCAVAYQAQMPRRDRPQQPRPLPPVRFR